VGVLTGVGDEGEESDFGEGQTGGGSCQPTRFLPVTVHLWSNDGKGAEHELQEGPVMVTTNIDTERKRIGNLMGTTSKCARERQHGTRSTR
jgi:hypothetical protein